ncbi:hypothetical protein SEVIR_1G330500v4 [Setaria viridis]|uniref:Uncharacterized protein n=1 Tax=Setaria viridis TaxID=4556 RepID=A0A4U6WHB2_SETVI|nr:hypothetical protein SEVIR_1G330500v2 [Setaria viridis]TKW41645.1 hypothetical protein SEVIR_1G330500v2 [Setaria viridis]
MEGFNSQHAAVAPANAAVVDPYSRSNLGGVSVKYWIAINSIDPVFGSILLIAIQFGGKCKILDRDNNHDPNIFHNLPWILQIRPAYASSAGAAVKTSSPAAAEGDLAQCPVPAGGQLAVRRRGSQGALQSADSMTKRSP